MSTSRTVPDNHWLGDRQRLAAAYGASLGIIRIELVSLALRQMLPATGARVLDIGGGGGLLAVSLARHGHETVIIDADAAMLDRARGLLETETAEVGARVTLIHGRGEDAAGLVDGAFDAVNCDSVLMYVSDPEPMIRAMVGLAADDGVLSVVSVNPDAWAMRSGLQGRWREAIDKLANDHYSTDIYLHNERHPRSRIEELLSRHGAEPEQWFGVGVFTDHIAGPVVANEPAEVIEAEWLAGRTSPYRDIARCYHIIARKRRPPGPD